MSISTFWPGYPVAFLPTDVADENLLPLRVATAAK